MEILIVSESDIDYGNTLDALEQLNIQLLTSRAVDVQDAKNKLQNKDYDIILVNLNSEAIIDFIKNINHKTYKNNIIAISEDSNYDMIKSAMKSGAKQFICKDDLDAKSLEESIIFAAYKNSNKCTKKVKK